MYYTRCQLTTDPNKTHRRYSQLNTNQKQRIMQLSEKTLIIGVDIAKVNHVARAQDFRGIELGKRLLFKNTRDGLDRLGSMDQKPSGSAQQSHSEMIRNFRK